MSLANCLSKLNSGKPIFSNAEVKEITRRAAKEKIKSMGKGVHVDESERNAVKSMLDEAIAEQQMVLELVHEAMGLPKPKPESVDTVDSVPEKVVEEQVQTPAEEFTNEPAVAPVQETPATPIAHEDVSPNQENVDMSPEPVQKTAENEQVEPAQEGGVTITAKLKRANSETESGTNKAIIESMVKRVQTGWKNGPTIIVVQSVEELLTLNPALYGEVLSQGAEGDMEGVYLPDSKTVYLISDHLDSNKHAMQVLLHETKGHYGLREVFGAGLTPILNQIYATNKVVRERADKFTQLYGYNKALATEEALADLAGEGQAEKLNLFSRLVAFIRTRLHSWGVKWSDADVRALLAKSGRFVENGTAKARVAHGGGTAASRGAISRKQYQWQHVSSGSNGPVYVGNGFNLVATRKLRFESDIEASDLHLGHVHQVPEGSQPYHFAIMSKTGQPLGYMVADVDHKNNLVAIHDIEVQNKSRGLGTQIVSQMTANTDSLKIIEAIPQSQPFWNKFGIGDLDEYNTGNINWQGAAKHLAGQQASAQQEADGRGNELQTDGAGQAGPSSAGVEVGEVSADEASKYQFSRKTPSIALPIQQANLRKAKRATMEDDVSFVDRALRGAFRLTRADKLIDKSFDFVLRNAGELIPENIKAGIVSDYGLDVAYVDRKADMKAAEAASARKTQGMIEMLSGLTRAESRVAYYWMQEKPDGVTEQRLLDQLPEASRETLAQLKSLITHLGNEAVRLGQLSAESQARNNMSYLHRTYAKHVLNQEGAIAKMLRARSMRIKGNQYKGRGIFEEVPMDRIMSANPDFWRKLQAGKADKSLKGETLIRFERRDASAELMDALDGFDKKAMGKLREVVYWPSSAPVPAKYDAWVNAGTFEVRDTKGDKLVVWRDLTRDERTKLGELDEVRYAVAQTMSLMTHDIEVGRFFEWVSSQYAKPRPEGREVEANEGLQHAFGKDTWVQVPSSNILGTQVKKYGKLAGLYVPGPVWNDMRQVAGYQQGGFAKLYGTLLRFWKKSKTAWSPGVHVNNVMANFILADWHDIRAMDMAEALKVWAMNSKPGYKELFQRFEDSGALGGMFASNELLREEIGLRLEEMKADLTGEQDAEAETGKMAKVLHLAALAGVPFKGYAKHMGNAYQNEDAFFRLAVFIKAVRYGKSDLEAGKMARHAFLNYDINAPWIQAARHTLLPFISFPYRALPMLVNTVQHKPWKSVKLMAFASLVNMLGYAMLGDDDDEEKERKLLPEQKQGKLWGIVPKMMRMPWNSDTGAPVFLDVRRWVPVGDIADLDQGHGLPPSLVPGGPLVTLAEAFLFNKSLFTQKEVTKETDDFSDAANKKLDHVFKAMAPNVPVPNPIGYLLSDEKGQYQTYAISGIHNAIDRKENTIGEVRSPVQAGLNAVGIKVSSYPKQNMEAAINIDLRKKVNALKDESVKDQRNYNRLAKPSSDDYKSLMAKIRANERKIIEARKEADARK